MTEGLLLELRRQEAEAGAESNAAPAGSLDARFYAGKSYGLHAAVAILEAQPLYKAAVDGDILRANLTTLAREIDHERGANIVPRTVINIRWLLAEFEAILNWRGAPKPMGDEDFAQHLAKLPKEG